MNATTRRLSGNLLRELAASMPVQRFPAGTTLLTEGDSADFLYVLIEGQLKVYSGNSKGREVVYNILEPGEFFGEMMLDGEPRYASCAAIEEVEAGLLSRAAIAHLIQDHPAVGAKLLGKLTQLLAQRLRNTSNQLVRALEKARGGARFTFKDGDSGPS